MLWGIPFSIFGSIFGAIMGFIAKASAMRNEVVASERKHQLDAMVAVSVANSQAVEDEVKLLQAKADYEKAVHKSDPHRSMARRAIAYILVIAITVVIPALIILFPDLQWFEIHTWRSNGFFGIGARQVTEVITATGLPLLWLDGLLTFVATVTGFYFGGSAAKFTNPYTKR